MEDKIPTTRNPCLRNLLIEVYSIKPCDHVVFVHRSKVLDVQALRSQPTTNVLWDKLLV